MNTYDGITGILRKAEKEAVDFLIESLREITNFRGRVDIYGYYKQPNYWRVNEVSFSEKVEGGLAGGSWQGCIPEHLGILRACEDVLINADLSPYRPEGWDSDIDDRGDAIWRLEEVLSLSKKENSNA